MVNLLRLDPTRTTTIRKRYMSEMRRRFYTVRSLVIQAVWKQDALGLKESKELTFNEEIVSNALPGREAWRFQTDAQKLASFQRWFQQQIDLEILTVDAVGNPWSAQYVSSAYRKGVISSYNNVNPEAVADSLDFYQGSKAQFLESSFAQPERLSKLQFLYTRSFEELQGITAAMSQQVSRVLADGIASGKSPRVLARELSKTITGITKKRALVLARTEIIAAHAEGQLDALQELGIKKVKAMAEWSTAGDDLVCPLCEPLEGAIMTIKEARGLIPRHPNCRCMWIPANVGERSQKAIRKARAKTPTKIKKSLKAELPKKTRAGDRVPQTVDEAVDRSTWAGKEEVTANICEHLTINEKWFTDYMEAIQDYRN